MQISTVISDQYLQIRSLNIMGHWIFTLSKISTQNTTAVHCNNNIVNRVRQVALTAQEWATMTLGHVLLSLV